MVDKDILTKVFNLKLDYDPEYSKLDYMKIENVSFNDVIKSEEDFKQVFGRK